MQACAPKILFFDDDDGFRYATAKALERAGFAVTAERDYVGALKMLE